MSAEGGTIAVPPFFVRRRRSKSFTSSGRPDALRGSDRVTHLDRSASLAAALLFHAGAGAHIRYPSSQMRYPWPTTTNIPDDTLSEEASALGQRVKGATKDGIGAITGNERLERR